MATVQNQTTNNLPRLLPYQHAWITDQAPLKVFEKSRRIGITFAEACAAALDAARKNGTDWWYIGYNKEMALEFVEAAAWWARKFNAAAQAIEQTMLEDEDKDILAYRIRFASSHKIVALSSRPANLRGKQGVAIIDEAAFHPDLKGLITAALAMTMWAGKVHVISTHNGAESEFARLITDIRAGRRNFSLHRTTLDDALDQGLYRIICETTGQQWTPEAQEAWRSALVAEYGDKADEELFCIPQAESLVYLSTALIESRMNADIPVLRWRLPPEALQRGTVTLERDAEDWIRTVLEPHRRLIQGNLMSCIGEDFGRSADLTVIWPLQIGHQLERHTPFVIELAGIPFSQQYQILHHTISALPRFIGAAMDAGGNGQYLAEQAALRWGQHVEAINLNIEFYRDNFPRLKSALEDGTIDLPKDDGILADLRMLRLEKGVPRVPETRINDPTGPGQRHGDSAIAACLAVHASRSGNGEYAYITQQQNGNLFPFYEEDYRGTNGGWSRQAWGRSKGSW